MKDYNISAGLPALPNQTQLSNTLPDSGIPDCSHPVTTPDQSRLEDIADVIEFCKVHGFPADVVGRWVWIRFDEKPDTETRELLKAAGFRWVRARMQWAHNCGYHSRKGKGNPRWKYGSIPVNEINRDELKVLKGVPA